MKRLQLVEDEYNMIHDCSDLEVVQARLLGREEMKMFILEKLASTNADLWVSAFIEDLECKGDIT